MTEKHIKTRKKQIAFTLIEIVVVVAVIGILAAIAVPNFLQSMGRAKVSRAIADMKTLAQALDAYYVDHNAYPPDSARPGIPIED